ncbi:MULTISPECIES: hypothetical protein [Bradyrhizobium]|uniref:hypothetical protein n=1 Tax=Bradyrhizobium TaxID=374 RepID=UPI001BAC6BE8|nr:MULTISPECIES: hypothetical protein [Bradyrhizobium]MBR0708683.1 hypothetical protein [Bradyrhizobium liaoningense]
MTTVGKFLAFCLIAWFGAMLLLVLIRVLLDRGASRGLLVSDGHRDRSKRQPRDERVNPERVMAAAIVPAVLAAYTIHALNTGIVTTETGAMSMPDLPENLLTLLTGGNGLYLAGKIARRS